MEEAPESRAKPEAVLSIAGIQEAAARISPYVHRTPVLTCGALDEMSGGRQAVSYTHLTLPTILLV